jgi:hypothetical protein
MLHPYRGARMWGGNIPTVASLRSLRWASLFGHAVAGNFMPAYAGMSFVLHRGSDDIC